MHVVVREVIGPNGCFGGTRVQIDTDVHLAGGEINQIAWLVWFASLADLYAIERDINVVWVKRGVGRTYRREHATPVGVVAEDGGLEQVRA